MQISTSIVLASALLLAPLAAQADDHRTAAPEGAAVYFITPEDGARVTSPVLVRFGWLLRHGREARAEAFILTGMAAGYLPWMLYLHRTVFQFYTVAFEAFLVLALVAAIALLIGPPGDPERRYVVGRVLVAAFLVAVAALSVFFWPLWIGEPIPIGYLRAHYWFASWI